MQFLRKVWTYFSEIGVYANTSDIETDRIKLLNHMAFFVCLFELTIIIRGFWWWELSELVIYFIFSVTLLVFVFNHFRKYIFARLVLTFFFPLLVFGSIIAFGKNLGGEYPFLVFLVIILIFHHNTVIRNGLLIWNTLIFIFSVWYTNTYESPYEYRIDIVDKLSLYFASGVALVLIIQLFTRQKERFFQQKNELNKSLEENNEKLENANNELNRFAEIASHDLKTPTRSIVSFSGLLERSIKRDDKESSLEYLTYIKASANQMNFLIADILEISKLGGDAGELSEIDLNEIIEIIIVQIKGFLDENNAELIYDDLGKVSANRVHMILLFKNLIENGIKYNTSENKFVKITTSTKDNFHQICFQDNGIGISEEYQDTIFEMFKRLHSAHDYTGTGLGLAACKKIVEGYGGEIWVESSEDKGSKFCIQLPQK